MTHSISRRAAVKRLGALGLSVTGAGLAAGLGLVSRASLAASDDYRVLVVVHLQGGHDGHDVLIPTDGAYLDYAKVRGDLALAKDSLIALNGNSAGHTFALPPALKSLAPLYNTGRLAMVANVGALIKPVRAVDVAAQAALVPPFLFSHSDQTAYIQGWMGDADPSGWAGRAVELMPAALRKTMPVISYAWDSTLVLGRTSRFAQAQAGGGQYWGASDLNQPHDVSTSALQALGNLQSNNLYEAEYARTFRATFQDATALSLASAKAGVPAGNFGSDSLATDLRHVASMLPVFKAQGVRRQVILVSLGRFDTHVTQRGSSEFSLDTQLAIVGPALAAFDTAIRAAGLDQNVVTLTMSEFGRTLLPTATGTDHAWGNNWLLMGGLVQGGQVLGTLPSLVLGGPDDGDPYKKGRWVPTTSSDQVGATLMQWLGLPSEQLLAAFPNLSNFAQKTLPLLRA
ncbi:MAG: DUF1501 domain-containing protein [Pseudomonadota bacterium]